MICDEGAVFFSGHFALLELPLTFEQSGFVGERENIVERNIFDDARAVERSARNANIRAYVGRVVCVVSPEILWRRAASQCVWC
jgi:hypothetical protein